MWNTIEDAKIRHIWASEETGEEAVVSPAWYEDNGTPMDSEGNDMTYLRTEIFVE